MIITWELIRDAEPQAPTEVYRITIFLLANPLRKCMHIKKLRSMGLEIPLRNGWRVEKPVNDTGKVWLLRKEKN